MKLGARRPRDLGCTLGALACILAGLLVLPAHGGQRHRLRERDFWIHAADGTVLGRTIPQALKQLGKPHLPKLVQSHFHLSYDQPAGVNAVLLGIDAVARDKWGKDGSWILCGSPPSRPAPNALFVPALAADYDRHLPVETRARIVDRLVQGVFGPLSSAASTTLIHQNQHVALNLASLSASCIAAQTGRPGRAIWHNHDPRFSRLESRLAGGVLQQHFPPMAQRGIAIVSNGPERTAEIADYLDRHRIAHRGHALRTWLSRIHPMPFQPLPHTVGALVPAASPLRGQHAKTRLYLGEANDDREVRLLALSPVVRHKNIIGAIDLSREMARQLRGQGTTVRLIITGMHDVPTLHGKEDAYLAEVRRHLASFAAETQPGHYRAADHDGHLRVVILGGVQERYKRALIKHSDALLYLSVPRTNEGGTEGGTHETSPSEGMGMPPVETGYYAIEDTKRDRAPRPTICAVASGLPRAGKIGSLQIEVGDTSGELLAPRRDAARLIHALHDPKAREDLATKRHSEVVKNHLLDESALEQLLGPPQ